MCFECFEFQWGSDACRKVGVGKIDFQLSKNRCMEVSETVFSLSLTHTYIHAQENMPAHHNHRHSPTQTTHTVLYSGGRLIEGYNWGAGDERLSTGTCACVHYSPSLLALTSSLLTSSLFLLSLPISLSLSFFPSLSLSPSLSLFISSFLSLLLCLHPEPSQNVQPCRYLQSH